MTDGDGTPGVVEILDSGRSLVEIPTDEPTDVEGVALLMKFEVKSTLLLRVLVIDTGPPLKDGASSTPISTPLSPPHLRQ